MPKKKNRQQEPSASYGRESTDSEGEGKEVSKFCQHIGKAVDLNTVKKKLKGASINALCSLCVKGVQSKQLTTSQESNNNNINNNDGDKEMDGGMVDTNPRLWMCLKCGNIGCGRFQSRHALDHYSTPRSDVHAMVVDIESLTVWCYICELEMSSQSTKKLQECVEYIRRQLQSNSESGPPSSSSKLEDVSPSDCKSVLEGVPLSAPEATVAGVHVVRAVVNDYQSNNRKIPGVRGLMNLGNTCYYNSVLQCLSVTPFLTRTLNQLTLSGESFFLKGDPDAADGGVPELRGVLGETGSLTTSLLALLNDMRNTSLTASSLRPHKLLSEVQNRFAQFQGHDQHDAHELLRHLLEGVRADDLKRHQRVVLNENGCVKSNPEKVPEDIRRKIKFYGQQLSDLTLGPEGIFKGQLVSMLECQDCRHLSTRTENFLDLSLPLAEDKPCPPTRKKEPLDTYGDDMPSKYQLKKQKKDAKRARKGAKGRMANYISPEISTPTIVEENGNSANGAESEQSDADVEDNIEQESSSAANTKEVEESGYSSERHNTGESERTSPSIKTDHCAQPASSPSSPQEDCNWGEYCTPLNESCDGGNNNNNNNNNDDDDENYNNNCPDVTDRNRISVCSVEEQLTLAIPPEDLELNSLDTSPIDACTFETPSHNNLKSESKISPTSPQSAVDDRPVSRCGFSPIQGEILQCSPSLEEDSDDGKSLNGPDLQRRLRLLSLDMGKENIGDMESEKEHIDLGNEEVINKGAGLKGTSDAGDTNNVDCVKSESSSWCQTLAPRHQTEEGECSVVSCLNQFTSLELMTGNNKAGCDACTQRQNKGKEGKTVYTNSTKQLLISSPPPVLILHLKRFMMENCRFKKLQRYVSFPVHLDMAPFCSNRCKDLPSVKPHQNEVLYTLYGVVEHTGSLSSGHYVAYIKVRPSLGEDDPRWAFLPQNRSFVYPPKSTPSAADTAKTSQASATNELDEQWYLISDSRVNKVTEAKVLKSQAYLLFYERVM